MDPPPPALPLGQLGLMIFSWMSFFLYIQLILVVLTQKRSNSILSSPFYMILVFCSIGDFAMFFHIELVMRPRKFRFLPFLFNSATPNWFAYYSYFLSAFFRTAMQLSYILMAVNRFTAFAMPFYYKTIWKTRYIFYYTCIIWGFSLFLTLNLFFWEDVEMQWSILPSGVMQTLANRYFYLDAVLSTSVCISSSLICVIFYALGAWYSSKSNIQRSARIERKLFGCSLLATVPLLIESAKSLVVLYATIKNNRDMLVFLTEFWFYWTEFMTNSPCWSVILVTPYVRKLVIELGFFGAFVCNKTAPIPSIHSSIRSVTMPTPI